MYSTLGIECLRKTSVYVDEDKYIINSTFFLLFFVEVHEAYLSAIHDLYDLRIVAYMIRDRDKQSISRAKAVDTAEVTGVKRENGLKIRTVTFYSHGPAIHKYFVVAVHLSGCPPDIEVPYPKIRQKIERIFVQPVAQVLLIND